MRVTARRQESEQGLARVCQSPRGFVISLDGKRVGHVGFARPFGSVTDRSEEHWFWYAHVGDVSRNSASHCSYYATREAARDACIEWVKATAREAQRTAKATDR